MSVLTGVELLRRMSTFEDEPDQQLAITPLLDVSSQVQSRSASVDLRLGSSFLTLQQGDTLGIDWSSGESANKFRGLFQRTYVPLGGSYVIHPNQFVLAATLEWLRMPNDLMAYVVTRSSWGRAGLIVATAVGVHPGFCGVITLELRNLGDVPVKLRPGEKLLQLVFHEAKPPAPFEMGTYRLSVEATPAEPRPEPLLNAFPER